MAKEGYAVKKGTTREDQVARFRLDIQERIRMRIREAIEEVFQEELAEALGSGPYERSEQRRGYRNGFEDRIVTTEAGTRQLRIPRGRIAREDGTTSEFRSEILPRYARRTRAIDEALLGIYLAGANSRRIRKALTPLFCEHHFSMIAI